jgi:hypothetical protein
MPLYRVADGNHRWRNPSGEVHASSQGVDGNDGIGCFLRGSPDRNSSPAKAKCGSGVGNGREQCPVHPSDGQLDLTRRPGLGSPTTDGSSRRVGSR